MTQKEAKKAIDRTLKRFAAFLFWLSKANPTAERAIEWRNAKTNHALAVEMGWPA